MRNSAITSDADRQFETLPVLDVSEFDTLLEDVGGEVMAMTLETFFAETDARLARVRDGLAGEELAREAHSLKGGASTFGAARLARIARIIECDSVDGQSADPALIEAAEQVFAATRTHLERQIEAGISAAA